MSALLLVLLGSIVCYGLGGKQDLKRSMPNGRPMAKQVDQAAKGQTRYVPYNLEGEKPLRKERALWPFGLDYHDDHDDHDFHDHHHDDYDFHDHHYNDHHHDDHDFHHHYHQDPHDHYDAHERHHHQFEHLHEHGYGP